jgi:porphobilinogen deaminase
MHLTIGEADIAVHSLKDMSSEHFFGANKFAVVDRDDTRDVAIFNNDIEEKIKRGETIIIGTCSPRREEMATVFLKKALPAINVRN